MMTSSELKKDALKNLKGHKAKAGGTFLVYFGFVLVISFVLGLMSVFVPFVSVLLQIAMYVIMPAILYGCITVLMRIKRGEKASAFSCISEGFKKIGKVLAATIWGGIKLLLWILLMVVGVVLLSFVQYSIDNQNVGAICALVGAILYFVSMIVLLIKSFKYVLVNYLIFDNPDMSGKQIVEKSAELMKGNCGRYFGLSLSFFGWFILLYFGMGISGAAMSSFWISATERILGTVGYFVCLFLVGFLLVPYIQMSYISFYEELIGKNKEEEVTENF